MRRRHRPLLLAPGGPTYFPDPDQADDEGLLAVGGDLSEARLLHAYACGVFPWYDAGLPPLWWSPNPRAVIELCDLHVSRSMRRVLAAPRLRLSWNEDFGAVMRACGEERDGGTWILPEMLRAYTKLHFAGAAHSLEVWDGDRLVGGIYGVQRGALFAAESMFHRAPNASKLALISCVRTVFAAGCELFDVQFLTAHLASMGAREISRTQYLERVRLAQGKLVNLGDLKPCRD